jgi:hypothetical protein
MCSDLHEILAMPVKQTSPVAAASRHKRIHPARFAGAMVLVLTCSGLMIVGVRQLPQSPLGYGIACGLGALFTLVNASVLEWLVHRYVYHRNWIPGLRRIYAIHHPGHHFTFFPTWRYVSDGSPRRHKILGNDASQLHTSNWENSLVELAHFSFYMTIGALCLWTPAWFLTRNIPFLAGLVVTSAVVSDLFVRVHDAIHYPGRYPWIETRAGFAFLDRHHFIHHVDTEANVNFLLPLADWLLGTLRVGLTPSESARHGSHEEAKANPVGRSAPAREVAQPRQTESVHTKPPRPDREASLS